MLNLKTICYEYQSDFFYLFFHPEKKKQPEFALLYVRVTVNSKSLEISLKRALPVQKWNQQACKMLGTGIESQQINKKIQSTRMGLNLAYDSLINQDQIITAHLIKTRFLGTDQQHQTLENLLD